MGAGTIFKEGGQETARCDSADLFFTLPPLLSNLPTLDRLFWLGKSASLPTKITKRKTRIVYLALDSTVFAQNPGWAVVT